MRLAFKIAVRFLKSSKGQTILIALGIAIGVSVQVFIGSLIQGLQKSLIDKTIGSSAQVSIVSNLEDKAFEAYEDIMNIAKSSDTRITVASAAVDGPQFIQANGKLEPILLRGLSLKEAEGLYKLKDRIYEGKAPNGENEVILGRNLAEELKAKIGDEISIVAAYGNKKEVKVSGLYDFKVANLNKSWVISNMKTAQDILGLDNKATSIEMQVSEVFAADEIATLIENKLSNKNLKVTNWKVQNEELLSGLKGQSMSSIMIQVFVLVAVVLGIASVLAITVLQKSKQLGILKAMGIKDKDASLIFIFEGLLLGVLGAVLGIAFGLFLSFTFTKFALNPDGTPVIALYIDPKFIAFSAIIAVLSATIAALIPARKSSKLNPIEVIKNA